MSEPGRSVFNSIVGLSERYDRVSLQPVMMNSRMTIVVATIMLLWGFECIISSFLWYLVSFDFKTNHAGHRFKRFPKSGGTPHVLEDLLRKNHPGFSTLKRSAQDRAFDDLYRQFFVAYSRAQEGLLLVGVSPTYPGNRAINVATGWQRDESCAWSGNVPFLDI